MAGFVVERADSRQGFPGPLRLVDLGDCEIVRGYECPGVRAGWARWPGSRQLTILEDRGRLLFVEGQPDRPPRPGEAARDWLDGRTGSFRGFEIEDPGGGRPARVCVFVDPLGTRPVFLLRRGDRVLAADKLSTVVANTPGLECAWPGLLEAAVLGALYSRGTTIRDVEQLGPGAIVEIDGVEISRRTGTTYPLASAEHPTPDAAARLGEALRTAIADTWTDPEGRLLLSGGLDSRLVLGLADGERKALTLDWFPEETPIAERVAAACSAELQLIPFRADDYDERMRHGYLVTGAAHDSRLVNNLGMATKWRRAGISAIVHGYFHNTIFRGWTAGRWQRHPDLGTPLAQFLGKKAHYFDNFGHFPLRLRAEVLRLLSPEGRRVLSRQLGALADSIEPVVVDGFDLTFERLVMGQVARQIYFGIFLGWLEEIDAESPVFHEASWRWYASTHPADRHRDRAVFELYQSVGRGLADIPDFTTGRPVRLEAAEPREAWRNQFWFPAARSLVRAGRRLSRPAPPPPQPRGHDWEQVFRRPPIADALQAGLAALEDNPLFDRDKVELALKAYLDGDAGRADSLWVLAKGGQWQRFVEAREPDDPVVRRIPASSLPGR
ncbi:MAG TPA: asparagine synthase-related protein [Stellaceae bacterium]|nr:asparagine synthase-related protein [Stellaceae bacterium]